LTVTIQGDEAYIVGHELDDLGEALEEAGFGPACTKVFQAGILPQDAVTFEY
jgi:hypothetical protein